MWTVYHWSGPRREYNKFYKIWKFRDLDQSKRVTQKLLFDYNNKNSRQQKCVTCTACMFTLTSGIWTWVYITMTCVVSTRPFTSCESPVWRDFHSGCHVVWMFYFPYYVVNVLTGDVHDDDLCCLNTMFYQLKIKRRRKCECEISYVF